MRTLGPKSRITVETHGYYALCRNCSKTGRQLGFKLSVFVPGPQLGLIFLIIWRSTKSSGEVRWLKQQTVFKAPRGDSLDLIILIHCRLAASFWAAVECRCGGRKKACVCVAGRAVFVKVSEYTLCDVCEGVVCVCSLLQPPVKAPHCLHGSNQSTRNL